MKTSSKKRVASISVGDGPIWELVALAIGLAVVGVVAGLSLLPAGTSAGLISASSSINSFLTLVGLGIAVGVMEITFSYAKKRRR